MRNRNWAPIPVLAKMEETTVLLEECETCLHVEAVRTVTYVHGFVFDDDDGLPLSFPGERSYSDGPVMAQPRHLFAGWEVAEHRI